MLMVIWKYVKTYKNEKVQFSFEEASCQELCDEVLAEWDYSDMYSY